METFKTEDIEIGKKIEEIIINYQDKIDKYPLVFNNLSIEKTQCPFKFGRKLITSKESNLLLDKLDYDCTYNSCEEYCMSNVSLFFKSKYGYIEYNIEKGLKIPDSMPELRKYDFGYNNFFYCALIGKPEKELLEQIQKDLNDFEREIENIIRKSAI